MADLHTLLDAEDLKAQALRRRQPMQRVLYEALQQAVAQGHLQAGAALPSSRDLARDLGVARNSVIYAYEQLHAEGYVQTSRQGTIVAALRTPVPLPVARSIGRAGSAALAKRVQGFDRRRTPEDDLLPFMPGMPALDAFPVRTWQSLCERAARQGSPSELGYRWSVGEPELRQAIATYLRAARGVRCHPDQVMVTDGTQHSLALCAQLLADAGDTVWIEHPGYGGARTAFAQAGLKQVPVTVDAQGISPPASLWRTHAPHLIYTTPSHQYPLGSVLSLPRRLSLIEQARQTGAWILEDDYDSEFRHDGPPLSAMQGQVDDAPVVYLGTFSKSMFPALRLGFIVWPAALADRAAGVAGALVRGGRTTEQRALAAFIGEGHFTRHLRKMRRLYALRQATLRDALLQHWPWPGTVLGGQAGLHLVLSLPLTPSPGSSVPDVALADAAYEQGLSPRPLSVYGTGGIAGFNGLVMGYANTHEDTMADKVRQLVACAPQR